MIGFTVTRIHGFVDADCPSIVAEIVASKTILLTRGKCAYVDEKDYERLNKYAWYAHKGRYTWYARRNGKKVEGIKSPSRYLHQDVLGVDGDVEVDHIDMNGLNCRRKNLRSGTRSQNALNARVPVTSSTGIKGVTWAKHAKKWMAKITIRGHQKYLGYFKTVSGAKKAVEFERRISYRNMQCC